jgi:hypothetical protein
MSNIRAGKKKLPTPTFAINFIPVLMHTLPSKHREAGVKLTCILCRGQQFMELHLHSPTHFHGVMLSYIPDLVNPDIALSINPRKKKSSPLKSGV